MALVFCRECGKQISDTAAACPGCGAPQAAASVQATSGESDSTGGYKPIVPPREFNAAGFIFAALVVAGGVYFAYGMVEFAGRDHRNAGAGLFGVVFGGALALAGLYSLLTNSIRVPGKLTFCPKCQMNVVARGTGSLISVWKCERCETRVKV